MTIDPQVLRAEHYVEIGHVLQKQASALIDQWSRRAAKEQPDATRVHEQILRDQLTQFLEALGRSLAESTTAENAPHRGPAVEHGIQRWGAGWSLIEVVRDYQILRLVIVEYLEGALRRPLTEREAQAIGLALDEAIAASVSAYVRHRDGAFHRLEQELRKQAEELLEADRRKNEFLAVLAHELRNPLAPILHSVAVLHLTAAGDQNIAEVAHIVERQVKQMTRLVDDLLDMTRIAQGKIELRRSTFDLAAAAAEAVQAATPLMEAQGHELNVSLPAEPLRVEGDPARIVQVVVNLLNNAAKYTDRGGRIRLEAHREGGEVVLSVGDNGIGIEKEMLGRVFDLFTQVDHSRTRSRGGLGIGLTLVRRLVELHGGRVAVHSDGPGRGSEFVVRLSAAPPADAAPAAAPEGSAALFAHTHYRGSCRLTFDAPTAADAVGPPRRDGPDGVRGVEAAAAPAGQEQWRREWTWACRGWTGCKRRPCGAGFGVSVLLSALSSVAFDADEVATVAGWADPANTWIWEHW